MLLEELQGLFLYAGERHHVSVFMLLFLTFDPSFILIMSTFDTSKIFNENLIEFKFNPMQDFHNTKTNEIFIALNFKKIEFLNLSEKLKTCYPTNTFLDSKWILKRKQMNA